MRVLDVACTVVKVVVAEDWMVVCISVTVLVVTEVDVVRLVLTDVCVVDATTVEVGVEAVTA